MDLRDASNKASVNQFIRSLTFPFETESVIGVPGAFFGPSTKNVDGRCALLIHELEHLNTLTSPLGLFYTGLGLRLKDLHDGSTRRFNVWQERIQDHSYPGMHEEALSVVESVARASRFTQRILSACEYILPLLEGLAVTAEMELGPEDDAPVFSLAVAFEFWRAYYLLLLTDPAWIAVLQDEDQRTGIVSALLQSLESQLEASRAVRRLEIGDRLFFRPQSAGGDPRSTAPYFFGYLLVRRLLQEWKQTSPQLSPAELFGIARAAFCSLLPLTLLYSCVTSNEETGLDEPAIVAAIESLFTLAKWQLQELTTGKLLALDPASGHLTLVSGTEDPDDDVMSWVLAGLYPDLAPASRAETKAGLWAVERCKFVKHLHTCRAVVIGLNEKHKLALISDASAIHASGAGSLGSSSAAWFAFQDEAAFQDFVQSCESAESRFARIAPQRAPIQIPDLQKTAAGILSTYCVFYPLGVRSSDPAAILTTPMTVVRQLTIECAGSTKVFLSDLMSLSNLSQVIAWQQINDHFAAALNHTLDPSLTGYRAAFGGMEDLYKQLVVADDLVRGVAEAVAAGSESADQASDSGPSELTEYGELVVDAAASARETIGPEWHSGMQSRCRAFYARLLFPNYTDAERLALDKLDVLADHLTIDDLDQLRFWLLYGAVLDRRRAYILRAEDPDSVAADARRIASVCVSVLGIPVVRYDSDQRAVVLDLAPRPA